MSELLTTKTRFTTLTTTLGIDKLLADETAEMLLKAYSEPQRHYHTLTHISHMLVGIGSQVLDEASKKKIEFAIWFHDVVYEPKNPHGVNEKESEHVWQEFVQKASPALDQLAEPVSVLIDCTVSHKLPTELPNTLSPKEVSLFLNLDISILATSAEEYDTYARYIRLEYGHVGDEEYRKGRAQVLEGFLGREKIFILADDEVKEKKARKNLQSEIQRIRI